MKKVLVVILSLFMITGCDMMDNKAKITVQEYLNNYIKRIENENQISHQNCGWENKSNKKYKDDLKKNDNQENNILLISNRFIISKNDIEKEKNSVI